MTARGWGEEKLSVLERFMGDASSAGRARLIKKTQYTAFREKRRVHARPYPETRERAMFPKLYCAFRNAVRTSVFITSTDGGAPTSFGCLKYIDFSRKRITKTRSLAANDGYK